MHVIPVIDLKGGVVVRAIAGARSTYTPVVSRVASNSDPETIAHTFSQEFKFEQVYVADLDAIAGNSPDWKSYNAIAKSGLSLLLDVGVTGVKEIESLVAWHGADSASHCSRESLGLPTHTRLSRLVIASECLGKMDLLPSLLSACHGVRATFSLDLRNGSLFGAGIECHPQRLQVASPLELIDQVVRVGFTSIIVLDLAAVGVDQGPKTLTLCHEIRQRYPAIELISGGGVRNPDDLVKYNTAGCNGVLVASALHDGRLSLEDLLPYRPNSPIGEPNASKRTSEKQLSEFNASIR